jgi:hypothetical protein
LGTAASLRFACSTICQAPLLTLTEERKEKSPHLDVTGSRMSLPIAVVAGIAAGGAALLIAVAVAIALLCRARLRARRNRTSETGSSDPSTLGRRTVFAMLLLSLATFHLR